jgi:hypothetical protein
MPGIILRDVYRRGQLKVDTTEIQQQKADVAMELKRIAEKREAKGAKLDDPVLSGVETQLANGFQRLAQVGGGVCHGLVYAWFGSLKENRTTLSFDQDSGRWTHARALVTERAVTNQARMAARFLSRTGTLGDEKAKSRAEQKLADESGFEETLTCCTEVSRPTIQGVMERVITTSLPNCYRISIDARGGKHSVGVVRFNSHVYLLDPNFGIVDYDRVDRFVDDLADVLLATDPGKGYAASSIRVFRAAAKPEPEGEDLDTLLANLMKSGSP